MPVSDTRARARARHTRQALTVLTVVVVGLICGSVNADLEYFYKYKLLDEVSSQTVTLQVLLFILPLLLTALSFSCLPCHKNPT
jgi:ABC-type uncharacterized transport system permease subunit